MSDNNEKPFNAETEESLDFSSSESLNTAGHADYALQEEYEKELEAAQQEPIDSEPAPEVVSKAKQFGHLSKEEWEAQGRDPKLWKSPQEFVKYGDEFKETRELIKQLKQQNQEYSKKIDILVDAHKQTAETAVQQAKRELEAQLQIAKDRGDINAVERLAQHKLNLDYQTQQTEYQRKLEEIRQVDEIFLERNKHWFNQSRPELMQQVAMISQDIDKFYPGITYAEKARRIEERMKFEHPEIVVNHNPMPTPTSMSNSAVNKSTAEHTAAPEDRAFKALSAEQRAEFNTVKKIVEKSSRGKIKYTIQDYLESNKKQRGR